MNKKVIDFLKDKKVNVITEDIESKLNVWEQWYKGEVDDFHKYHIYNGSKRIEKKRKSLNMAAKVSQDWADLLLNERVDISVNDDHTQEVLNRLLKQVNFYVRGNNLIELAFAIGGGFFIQYWDGENTRQKYISQRYMYPITIENGILKEAAFASDKTIGGKKYIYIETHLRDDKGYYVIDNFFLEKRGDELTEVGGDWYKKHQIIDKVQTQRKDPCFQMIKPNIANKDDFDSAFGTSVFSGATDALKSIDTWYSAYCSEIELGRKRIFVADSMLNIHIDSEGKIIETFDPNDEVFYKLPNLPGTENDSTPVTESNMELRVAELDQALQTQLNILSQLTGFGSNGYKWDSGNVATATQVVSENSKMFRTLKKHELVLNDVIVDMAKSLLYFEREFGKDEKINLNASITVDFDDSIIEDTAEIKRQALTDYNADLISMAEYFRQVYKLDEEQSNDFVKQMQTERNNELKLKDVDEEPEGA